jgi:hypothetical protein
MEIGGFALDMGVAYIFGKRMFRLQTDPAGRAVGLWVPAPMGRVCHLYGDLGV